MFKKVKFKCILMAQLMWLGCAPNSSFSNNSNAANSNRPFQAANVQKDWQSLCSESNDPMTQSNFSIVNLNLKDSTHFIYTQSFYSDANCQATSVNISYQVAGTFTVGGLVGKSTSLENLNFRLNSEDFISYNINTQNAVNRSCGPTSPYSAGANAAFNGTLESSAMMNCRGISFPTASNFYVNNVATFDGVHLTIGYPAAGIPGVLGGAVVPSTVGLQLQ